MLGNVFSPYYAARRQRGPTDPLDHNAFNVALYGRESRWALTEHPRRSLHRSAHGLTIGENRVSWEGRRLTVTFDERAAPFGGRLKGQVSIELPPVEASPLVLDAAGAHQWTPIAPRARASVRLTSPPFAFEGTAYVDANVGAEPLERRLARWSWSRMTDASETHVAYDVEERSGRKTSHALRFGVDGGVIETAPSPEVRLEPTRWGIERRARGHALTLRRTLEDTPFYARSLVEGRVGRAHAIGIHESLDLDRFAKSWVRFLLPFRMRRSR